MHDWTVMNDGDKRYFTQVTFDGGPLDRVTCTELVIQEKTEKLYLDIQKKDLYPFDKNNSGKWPKDTSTMILDWYYKLDSVSPKGLTNNAKFVWIEKMEKV